MPFRDVCVPRGVYRCDLVYEADNSLDSRKGTEDGGRVEGEMSVELNLHVCATLRAFL